VVLAGYVAHKPEKNCLARKFTPGLLPVFATSILLLHLALRRYLLASAKYRRNDDYDDQNNRLQDGTYNPPANENYCNYNDYNSNLTQVANHPIEKVKQEIWHTTLLRAYGG
jgi:hypothetical protein